MAEQERSAAEPRVSFWAWLRAFLLSPGTLFALLYAVARLLKESRLAWLIEWAMK